MASAADFMRSYTDELAPPPRPDTPITVGAGFGIRFLARGVDLLYGYLLTFIAAIGGGIIIAILSAMGRVGGDWVTKVQESSPMDYVMSILAFFLYHVLTDGISGTSVGKLLCKLNVVMLDGRPCSLLGALKRDVAYHWDALFFGLVAYQSMKESPLRQRYGDVWGKTIVVRKADFQPKPGNPAWRVVSGILLGSLVLMAVQFAALLMKVL